MNSSRKEYTFLWFIENYSHCWHKNGEKLISPEFSTYSLEGTDWNLQLYPRGFTDTYKGYISLCLRRKDDAGPEYVQVKCELSVLAKDESTLCSTEFEHTFKMYNGYGSGRFIKTDEVLSRKKAEYLPQDTLSVRCRIWKGEGEVQPLAQIYARTRIGIIQISFLHVTESFSTLAPNEKKTVLIGLTPKKGRALSCSLYLSDCSCCDEKIMVHITPAYINHKLSKCKLSIIDKSGKKFECGEIDHLLDSTGKNVQILPLSLTRRDILSKKSVYLPQDKLSLSCECSFSTGIADENIERVVLEKPFVSLTDNKCYKNSSAVSVCRREVILKCLLVAIFSCFFGIFVSYLWSD